MSRSFVSTIVRRSIRDFSSVVCLAGILTGASAALAQGLYQAPAPNLATGNTPQGVAAADFARSGFQSIVVTDSANRNMKVFLATGAATFGASNSYQTCARPTAVIAQDLNQDGYPDIVVACPSSNTIQLFLNNGAAGPGMFTSYADYSVTKPTAMVAGNFTGGGPLGLAVAGTNAVTVYLDIAGALVTKTVSVPGTPTGIVTGDFNHDGNLDLVVSDNTNNNVHLLTGDGAGNFTVAGSYTTGNNTKPSGIVAADFNNDGYLDVATTNAGTNTATVLLGSANGVLTLQQAQATGTDPIGIALADVNSDGLPDVVAFDAVSGSTGAVAVLLGNGDGTLQTAQISMQAFLPGTLPAVADFNRDGKPDLATAQQNMNQVSVLLNNTLPTQYPFGRSFGSAHALTNGYGNMADGVAVGDFNKDGLLDIAVSYLADNAVRVLTNNGGGFNTASVYPVGKQPYWIASADLNGDGYSDLVTANTTDGTVSVLLNNGKAGNGTFAAAATYTVGKQPYQVAIGDVNGDGFPDLAVTNYGANTVTVLLGSKTGTFTPSAATLATCANPYGVAIGDFAHNGHPSIAVTCYSAAQLEVFPNNGTGTFGTPTILTTDKNPSSIVVADFNRDTNLDIVVGNTTANVVDFFAGNGANGFGASVQSPSLNFPDSIAAADFNGDGILDIVGVAPNFNSVVVTLGVGNGTFGTFQQRAAGEFAATKQPWAVAVGDFNNDGQPDIVTANTYYQVNIASPAYQTRYLTEYPATPAGNPSIDVLTNASAANISLSILPPNNVAPLPANNSNVTIQASVQPAYSGVTPTGTVTFENASGVPLGTGPYPLNGGVATYNAGHLGSGQYVFTSLYSGDSNYQPTTASGAAFAVSVAGTSLSLTLSPGSVVYGSTFNASVTVNGTPGLGVPTGTVTVFSSTGFALGTFTLAASGNNSTGTARFTATAPNLNVGTYQLYASYTPTNGNYKFGTSSDVPLTVTAATTTSSDLCGNILGLISGCIDTVTGQYGGATPGTVSFSINGGTPIVEAVAGNTATLPYGFGAGTYTVVATYIPANPPGNFQTSQTSNNFAITCPIFGICYGGNDRRPIPVRLNSLTGTRSATEFSARPGVRVGRQFEPSPFTLY